MTQDNWQDCPDCKGSEIVGYKRGVKCLTCNGKGLIQASDGWQDCPTMKSVVEAMERGDQIQVGQNWRKWLGNAWSSEAKYRCRPTKPKTKTVVMREALCNNCSGYYIMFVDDQWINNMSESIIRLTGNERTEEVPYE